MTNSTRIALAALALTQVIGWGTTFNLPAITGTAMAEALGLSLPQIMAGPTVMLVVIAAASWGLAPLLERHGARVVMTGGSALGAVGLVIMALAGNPAMYFTAWVVLGLTGASALTTTAQVALAEVAGANAKQAIVGLMLFGGLTTTLFWPLTSVLQNWLGWRGVTGAYAGLMLVAVALHWLMLQKRPARREKAANAAPGAEIDGVSFFLLALAIAANGFVTWGFSLTIIVLFEGRGLDHGQAVFAASFLGVAQLGARLIDFAGGRRWNGLWTGLAAALVMPLSFAILLVGSGFGAAFAFVALYGLASGALAVARATMPLHFFSPQGYARASARLATPLNLAYAAAPPVFAYILTRHGGDAALVVATLASLVALGALLVLFRRER